jgi:acylphosphatase
VPELTSPQEPIRRARVVIHGRVQGVFFRVSCAHEARERGVSGWVRNLPGGAVEAVFEGPSAQVDAMIRFCRTGPPGAHVESVATTEEEPTGGSGFRVTG